GTMALAALILGCALFTWQVVRPMVTSSSAPLVVDLRPLVASREPVRDVAPGPERVERHEAKADPKPDAVVPPPLVHFPSSSISVHEISKPAMETASSAPAIPETSAPKNITAPPG